jgi:hypothetical protein
MSPQFCYTVSIGAAPKRELSRSYTAVSGVGKRKDQIGEIIVRVGRGYCGRRNRDRNRTNVDFIQAMLQHRTCPNPAIQNKI